MPRPSREFPRWGTLGDQGRFSCSSATEQPISAPEPHSPADLEPRKGSPSPRLSEEEFKRRFLNQFQDPGYERLSPELGKVAAAAWDAYANSRNLPPPGKPDPAKPIPNTIYRWIGLRPAKRLTQPSNDTKILTVL